MPLNDGAIFAGFRIVRLLGSGGMGDVYLVQHPRLPRRDALKVLPADVSADAEYRSRFNREADLASTLWHPHIVGVHDRGSPRAICGSPWTLSTVKTRRDFSPTDIPLECQSNRSCALSPLLRAQSITRTNRPCCIAT